MTVKLISPEATTNLCTNPSVELGTSGWGNTGMTTFERSTTWQSKGAWSVHAIANSVSDNVTLPPFSATNTNVYTVSFKVNVVSGDWRLTVDGNNEDFTDDGEYFVELTFTAGSTGNKTPTVTCQSASGEIYIDEVQYEQKAYRTTYCDGTQYGCTWSANEHASASSRHAQARLGGRELDLEEYFTDVEINSIKGAGIPPLDHVVQAAGMADGAYLQQVRTSPIVINIDCFAFAASVEAFHNLRRDLIDVLKPDRVFPLQPMLLVYDYSGEELEIECFYVRGLEGNLQAPAMYENMTLQVVAYDPRWKSRYNRGKSLTPYTTIADSDYILERRDGIWRAVGAGFNNEVNALVVDPGSGILYAGGKFTASGDGALTNLGGLAKWDGTSWSAMASGVGVAGNAGVESLMLDSQGRLYIAGQFTAPAGATNGAHLVRWNGTAFESLTPSGAASARVRGIAFGPDGTLYVGGGFSTIDTVAVPKVARRVGDAAWEEVIAGTAPNGDVTSLAISLDGEEIFIGGEFTSGFGLTTAGILKGIIDTAAAEEMIAGLNHFVYAMCRTPTGLLYLGGTFTEEDEGNATANQLVRVAAWQGSRFVGLGEGLGDYDPDVETDSSEATQIVKGLLRHPTTGELYAVGTFDMSGVFPVRNIGRFNGSLWTPLDVILPGNSPANSIAMDANGSRLFLGFPASGTAVAAAHTSVENLGSSEAYPVILLKGPGILRSIKNWTTGHEIVFPDLEIFTSETVMIDLTAGEKKVVSNKRGSLSSFVLPGGHLAHFSLRPGTNDIALLMQEANASPVYLGKGEVVSAAGGSSSIAVPRPGGIIADDQMVMSVAIQGTATIPTPPTGWTLIDTQTVDVSSTNARLYVYRKTATGGEPTTYTVTPSASARMAGAIVAFRNVNTSSPVDTSAKTTLASASKFLNFPTATASFNNERALYIAASVNTNGNSLKYTAASPLKERVDKEIASGELLNLHVSDRPIAAASTVPADLFSVKTGKVGGNRQTVDKMSSMLVLLRASAAVTQPTVSMHWNERYWSAEV